MIQLVQRIDRLNVVLWGAIKATVLSYGALEESHTKHFMHGVASLGESIALYFGVANNFAVTSQLVFGERHKLVWRSTSDFEA